jgi:nucleoporin NUP42
VFKASSIITHTSQIQLEAQFAAKANEAIQRILADVNGAIKYIIDGKDQHPNRLDMANNGSNTQPAQQQAAFGAPAAAPAPAAASGFGQPSGMGQQGSAFGKPSFGQPAAQSTFGQASAFGKPSQPGFGQASAVGGSGSAFGQPSQPTQASGFGQPSAVGGGAASAFGQPSAPGQSTGFGQPSQVGKPAFGQSAFGQPSQPAQSAFGQASKPAFGQASAAGQQSNTSPFGAAATQPSGFAQAAQQPATGFGQPSAFGAAAQQPAATGFGQPSAFGAAAQQPAATGFGQPSAFGAAATAATKPNPFSGPALGQRQQQPSPFGGAASNNAPQQQQQQQQTNPFGASPQPVQSALGQPSQFAAAAKPNQWFPKGPPAPNPDIQLEEVYYEGALGQELSKMYEAVAKDGAFPAGMGMPEVPPRREWVSWEV